VAAVDGYLDELARTLAVAQSRENARWGLIGKKEASSAYVGATWADDIRYLKSWVARRIAWLDMDLAGTCSKQ
jgi:hypothetical protein